MVHTTQQLIKTDLLNGKSYEYKTILLIYYRFKFVGYETT